VSYFGLDVFDLPMMLACGSMIYAEDIYSPYPL